MAKVKQSIPLIRGYSVRDILGEGANFELKNSNMNESEIEPAKGVFDSEVHLSLYRSDVMDFDSSKYKSPFEYFRTTFENVTRDGDIKKKVIRTGADVVVPPHSFVTFHCTSYVEYQDEPFDSSVLQNKPIRKKLNTGSLVPGLEQAVLTMRRCERAEFLVQPRLAYGLMGCPPRIPANAEILFDVELLDWTNTPDADLIEAIDELQLSDSLWEKAKTHASKMHMEGNDWVKNKKHLKALKSYSAAEKVVSNCRLKDAAEEKEHNIFLIKLYSNMAVCNYELKRYNDVCLNCREAILLKPNHAKGHYYWGQALKALGDYRLAKEHLLKADKYAPKDKAVHDALNSLEEAIRTQRERESLFCQRALNIKKGSETIKQKQAPTLSSPWKEQLTVFKNNSKDKRILLPGGLDMDELNAVRNDVEALNLKMKVNPSSVCVLKDD